MDGSRKGRTCCFIFRICELVACVICLALIIIMIIKPIGSGALQFVLIAVSVLFVVITLFDVIYYALKKQVYTFCPWFIFALLGVIAFFAIAIFMIVKESTSIALVLAGLVFVILAGIIFLLDLIYISYWRYRGKRNQQAPEERVTYRSAPSATFRPASAPRQPVQKSDEEDPRFIKCPPCPYTCTPKKQTSYNEVSPRKNVMSVTPRESRSSFREKTPIVVKVDKSVQAATALGCSCKTNTVTCDQCKWIKYLIRAQRKSDKRRRQKKQGEAVTTSSSTSNSDNDGVTKKKKTPQTHKSNSEDSRSVYKSQNIEQVKYIQPILTPEMPKAQTTTNSKASNKYTSTTAIKLATNPSPHTDEKYTQVDKKIEPVINRNTSTNAPDVRTSKVSRSIIQINNNEIPVRVVNYDKQMAVRKSEVVNKPIMTSYMHYSGLVPQLYITNSDDPESEISYKTESDVQFSPTAPCKQSKNSKENCACSNQPNEGDATCHCMDQFKKLQSPSSRNISPKPEQAYVSNKKRNGLDNETQQKQIRQASPLFHYKCCLTASSNETSVNSPPSKQSSAYRPTLMPKQRTVQKTSRSEPPKVLCSCNEKYTDSTERCTVHGYKNRNVSLPSSAHFSRMKETHSTQTPDKEDRFKTSP